tara:strand:- start:470 stop:1210 length:741 start_codon:yes stop_codon:yes gene_type:complete
MGELAYRVNFAVQLLETLLTLGTALAALAVVFGHVDDLGGWQPAELVALLGVFFLMGGVIGVIIQPGMQSLMEGVRSGTLDFVLTKPEDAQILVSLGEVRVWKLADVALGLTVIGLALGQVEAVLSPLQWLGFAAALAAGSAIVYSFWLILATFTFWFIRLDNVLIIFQAMYDAGRWPVAIYPGWLRAALTFLVPVAFAVTVPSQALVGRLSVDVLALAIGMALALLLASRLFWRFGIRRYAGASA